MFRARMLLLIWLALFANGPMFAQSVEETRAYDAAARSFQDAVYDRAEQQFAEFVRRFSSSPRVPEAILLQAQAAMQNNRLQAAIDLLVNNASRAGNLA